MMVRTSHVALGGGFTMYFVGSKCACTLGVHHIMLGKYGQLSRVRGEERKEYQMESTIGMLLREVLFQPFYAHGKCYEDTLLETA
eukprot:m.155088 g.155088  ORF g.155088 m.155088 type:complete len:85 (+) comp16267_c0_seq1:126-380(+)